MELSVQLQKKPKLTLLGELLSNENTSKIIKLLIDNEMYTNEIATKLDMRVSLVIHYLKKMFELDLLTVSNKKVIIGGQNHKFFKISDDWRCLFGIIDNKFSSHHYFEFQSKITDYIY